MFSDNLELLNEYVVLVEMAKPEISIGFILFQVFDKFKNDSKSFTENELTRLNVIETGINQEEFDTYCRGWESTNTWNSKNNLEDYVLQYNSVLAYIQPNYPQHQELLNILNKINLTIKDFKFIVIIYRKLFKHCFKPVKK